MGFNVKKTIDCNKRKSLAITYEACYDVAKVIKLCKKYYNRVDRHE